jgi:hypothetical protein
VSDDFFTVLAEELEGTPAPSCGRGSSQRGPFLDEFQTNAARRIPLLVLTRDERRRAEEIPVPALP